MSNKIRSLYEFEGFRLDTENPSLWRGNELVSIPPKALETLILLVRKQGEIVSRNQLLETIWHETFVEESNINYTISLIRKTLGEKDLIQTVPRRGYRFVGEIKDLSEKQEVSEALTIPSNVSRKSGPWVLISIFLFSLLFLTSLAFWWRSDEKTLSQQNENAEAMQSYTRGKAILDDRDVQNREEKAIAEFQKAVTIDPASAIAHAGLAEGFSALAVRISGDKGRENYAKAKVAAEKSISLDTNLAEAFEIRGWLKRNADWDFQGAETDLRRAIELKPDFALAHYRLSQTLVSLGKLDEALTEINKAYELNPVSEIISQGRFSIYESRSEHEKALKLAEDFLRENPTNPGAKRAVGTFLYHQNEFDKVIEMGEEVLAKTPERRPFAWLSLLSAAYFQKGNVEKSDEVLKDLIKQSQTETKALYSLAMNYAELNRIDEALSALEKCFAEHEERMVWLKVEPRFANLRKETRFVELARKLKLE